MVLDWPGDDELPFACEISDGEAAYELLNSLDRRNTSQKHEFLFSCAWYAKRRRFQHSVQQRRYEDQTRPRQILLDIRRFLQRERMMNGCPLKNIARQQGPIGVLFDAVQKLPA